MRGFALVALFVPALAACSRGKQEAASLVAAVDRFHKAENPEKPARADDLVGTACTDPEVCEAKRVCVAAADPLARGLRLKSDVEAKIAALGAGTLAKDSDDARALPAKLDEASKLLAAGHDAMPACDAKTMALRMKYGL